MEPPSTDLQEMNSNSSESVTVVAPVDEKKPPPPPSEHAPKCPRCDSENTKFCYYNNYSLSQPRYFCKSCRRYWTKGGALRNVPIGGGCRKNRRSTKRLLDHSYNHDLLLQSLVENNSNILLSSSSDQNLSNKVFSNFSSPALNFESPGSGESLSMAFAKLQKQCDGHGPLGLGFGFEPQNCIQAPPIFGNPIMTSDLSNQKSTSNLGFLSNFSESQTTSSFDSQSLYNYGLLDANVNQSYGHTQPLLPYEDLSFDLRSGGSSVLKQDMCDDNRILRQFPWHMGINSGQGSLTLENDYIVNNNNNNNNFVLGSSSSSSHNSSVENGFELVVGGRRESRNNNNVTESASAPSWPNLINTSVLM